jgi:tRNA A-37 threonylcarbamoyl transferase component Bud32
VIARADARLGLRDRRLPGLAVVLDAEAFCEALAGALRDVPVTGARATYVRYKPGVSCLVAFRVRVGEEEHDVYARALRRSAQDKLGAARRRTQEHSFLGPGGLVLDRWAVAVHASPHDRRLPTLAHLQDPQRRAKLFERLLPHHPHLRDGELTGLRYNPERRWVARLDAPAGRALVKVTQRAAVRRAMASRDALAGRAPIPHLLGATRRHGLVALEWLEGDALEDRLESTPRAAEAVGPALAAVHELDGLGLAMRPDSEAQRLTAAARATLVVSPALAQRADRLATALAGELRAAGPCTAVHGDFSADQVILGASGAMLVDLDETRRDDPTVDLAGFAAELRLRVVRGRLSAAAAEQAWDALREGYRAAGGCAVTAGPALSRRLAAALLLRAAEPFRLRDHDWDEQVVALVEEAERAAGAQGPTEETLVAAG